MHRGVSHFRLLSTAFILFSVVLLSLSSHAQYQPIPVSQICSAFIPGQALYVLGGLPSTRNQSILTQAFAIDLSVSWSTDMPVYRQLADGPRSGLAPCGISPDGKTWVVLVSSFVQTYDIASDTWGEIMPMQHVSLGPLTGAVDPDSGNLYVPFAVYGTGEQMYMLILNTKSPKSYYGEFNSSAPISDTDRTGYTVAWSRAMKGFVYVGGTEIYSYSPSTGWTDLRPLTSGQAPSGSRHYSCVVAAGDSKVIVFGGQSNITSSTTLEDIYILDVPTRTWKQGMSVNAPQGRSSGPCAYSNNQFIIWGGVRIRNGTSEVPSTLTMVYNLETDTWTSNYTAPSQPAKTSIGAIVGGAVGGGLVAAALAGFGVYRYGKRTHGNSFNEKPSRRPLDPHTDPPCHSTSRNPTYIPASSSSNTFVDPGYTYTHYPPVVVRSSLGRDYAAAFGFDQEPGHPHTAPQDMGSRLQANISATRDFDPPPPAMRTSLEGESPPKTNGVQDEKQHPETSNSSIHHPSVSD